MIIWTNGYIFYEDVESTIRNYVINLIDAIGLNVTTFNVSDGGTSLKGNGEIYQMEFDLPKISAFRDAYVEKLIDLCS